MDRTVCGHGRAKIVIAAAAQTSRLFRPRRFLKLVNVNFMASKILRCDVAFWGNDSLPSASMSENLVQRSTPESNNFVCSVFENSELILSSR